MKLGFFTAILPDLPLEQVVRFAALNNFECLEVACWPCGKADRKFSGITHIDVTDLSKTRATEIRSLCAANNLTISGLGYYPNPLDPDPAISGAAVTHIKAVILGAGLLGLNQVNTFVGRDWTRTIDENWPRFLDIWKPLIQFAEDNGVRIGIENCPMSFTRDEWPGGKNLAVSPVIWRRMFNDIPSNSFGLNYDPSHFVLQRMDPLSCLREFRDKLFHIHAKDMVVHPEKLNEVGIFDLPKNWHTPRIPGFGEIDWAQFMGRLNETGYTGAVCIEAEDGTFGQDLAGRQRSLTVARKVLAPYF
ncbi:MAG: sugar phosphate isomerase/epimerase [Verrucomicrobia bacterium]|nr:sugar phosphate isomerase/epimerase [Verrucomicrobiota bacterium]